MTYIPAVGDRVIVHHASIRNGKSCTFTGVITETGDPVKGPRFAWDGMGRFYLGPAEDLEKIGCVQTIELVKRADGT